MENRPIILLDVMETLVTEPFFTAMPAFFEMTLDELLTAKHPTSWIEFEKGQITEAQYLASFFRDGREVDGVGLRECLWNAYEWLEGMEDLVRELHAGGFELHALSNYPTWYQLIDEKLALSRFLTWSFVSCSTGLRKPDPQAYRHAASALSVESSDCLFIDDRPVNIAAARKLGMSTILMKDAASLRTAFIECGIPLKK